MVVKINGQPKPARLIFPPKPRKEHRLEFTIRRWMRWYELRQSHETD